MKSIYHDYESIYHTYFHRTRSPNFNESQSQRRQTHDPWIMSQKMHQQRISGNHRIPLLCNDPKSVFRAIWLIDTSPPQPLTAPQLRSRSRRSGRWRGISVFVLDFGRALEDDVDEAQLFGLIGSHEPISLHHGLEEGERLTRVFGVYAVQLRPHFDDFLRLNLDVRGLPLHAPTRLMNHDPGVGKAG